MSNLTCGARRRQVFTCISLAPTRMTRSQCQLCLAPKSDGRYWILIGEEVRGDWTGIVCGECARYARQLAFRGTIQPVFHE